MTGVFSREHWRAAIGLIAAYAIALQALFAAFAPLPAIAKGGEADPFSILCLSLHSEAPLPGDPNGPAHPASHALHCVLCGSIAAGAALLPSAGHAVPVLHVAPAHYSPLYNDTLALEAPARDGPARAPPMMMA